MGYAFRKVFDTIKPWRVFEAVLQILFDPDYRDLSKSDLPYLWQS